MVPRWAFPFYNPGMPGHGSCHGSLPSASHSLPTRCTSPRVLKSAVTCRGFPCIRPGRFGTPRIKLLPGASGGIRGANSALSLGRRDLSRVSGRKCNGTRVPSPVHTAVDAIFLPDRPGPASCYCPADFGPDSLPEQKDRQSALPGPTIGYV